MTDFDTWFRGQGAAPKAPVQAHQPGDYLANGLEVLAPGRYRARCRSCDRHFEIDWLDPHEAEAEDPDNLVCLGSQYCTL